MDWDYFLFREDMSELVSALATRSTLRTLKLAVTLRDSNLSCLASLTGLRELTIHGMEQVTVRFYKSKSMQVCLLLQSLMALTSLTNLELLGLPNASMLNDESLLMIARFTKLRVLVLSNTRTTDAILQDFTTLQRLTHLSIASCPAMLDVALPLLLPRLQYLQCGGATCDI